MNSKKLLTILCSVTIIFVGFFALICLADTKPVQINIQDSYVVIEETTNEVYVKPLPSVLILKQAKVNMSDEHCATLSDDIVTKARKYEVPEYIAFALVNTESDFNYKAHQKATNCVGLCQVSEICLQEYNKITNSKWTLDQVHYNQQLNLEVGFWYFNRLLTVYGVKYSIYDYDDAYIAYNVGPVNYSKYKQAYNSHKTPEGKVYNAKKRWVSKKTAWQNYLL